MRSRVLWQVVEVGARVLLVVSVLTGTIAVFALALERRGWDVLGTAAGVAVTALFWRWIELGARHRLRYGENDDGSTATAVAADTRRVGPWGMVGGVLTAVVLLGLLGLGLWSARSIQGDREAAESLRDHAVSVAKRERLTVTRLKQANMPDTVDSWEGEPGDRVHEILPLEHGRIVASSVDHDHASLLIRPDGGGSFCAVVDIVHEDLVRGRITDDC